MLLTYTRSKHACAADLPDGNLAVKAAVEETFFAAKVEMKVKIPDLEIGSVEGVIERCFSAECTKTTPRLQQAVGLRIGPGIIKLVNNLVGGSHGCPRLADLVLECCEQVILRYTVDPLGEILSKEGQELIEAHKKFLRQNPRLINSCIAFAEGSPLREGVELDL
ncbi:MAG: DUF2889 domain-containing protein [Bacillota bacterium]